MDNTVRVTFGDVRDFVESNSSHVPGALVDAVASELNARLGLVGDHPTTTVLNAATVPQWIAIRVENDLGQDLYDKILRENAVGDE
jgi:hypothetical protein